MVRNTNPKESFIKTYEKLLCYKSMIFFRSTEYVHSVHSENVLLSWLIKN